MYPFEPKCPSKYPAQLFPNNAVLFLIKSVKNISPCYLIVSVRKQDSKPTVCLKDHSFITHLLQVFIKHRRHWEDNNKLLPLMKLKVSYRRSRGIFNKIKF